ncbi:MAG: hypothetical protein INR73_08865 [Williamsia sp.]|nr:hypothetical protein [Williamsia sp.]
MRTPIPVLAAMFMLAISCYRSKIQIGDRASVLNPPYLTPDTAYIKPGTSLFRKGGVWPGSSFEFNFIYSG